MIFSANGLGVLSGALDYSLSGIYFTENALFRDQVCRSDIIIVNVCSRMACTLVLSPLFGLSP